MPLTAQGEANARGVGERLIQVPFACVLTSPLTRARRTCDLAGFGDRAVVDSDLLEWDYGAYEGKTRPEICSERPGWKISRLLQWAHTARARRALVRSRWRQRREQGLYGETRATRSVWYPSPMVVFVKLGWEKTDAPHQFGQRASG